MTVSAQNLEAEINELAQAERNQMVTFLRDMIRIPSESAEEKGVIERIKQEMEASGAFDKIEVDGLGNLLGWIGSGPRLIAIDAHVDTVGVGNLNEWAHDPYEGKVEDDKVWGRGAGDQEGAVPSMVAAAKIMKKLGLPDERYTVLMTFTVMEEDCDGLCWQYIHKEQNVTPEAVVITDSTDCVIRRGHRGRMEIGVTFPGKSCHGSMPQVGDNPVYKLSRVALEIEKLNENLQPDDFLGKGTITVSYVDVKTPSMCAVPASAFMHLDRRLTAGETKELAVQQVKDICEKMGVPDATVEVLQYEREAYTGLTYPTEKYFPTWVFDESDPHVQSAVSTYKNLFGEEQKPSRWTFSTNGVSIAGMFDIPCIGFGPAPEDVAHTVNDSVPIEHLIKCAAFYALYPKLYCDEHAEPVTKS
jgi:putative selenium metabolism hydrolase